MTYSSLTPTFLVGPQIEPETVAELAADGVTDIVCMRPDREHPDGPVSAEMRKAADAAGLRFHYLPVIPGLFEPEAVEALKTILADDRKVFGYCRSGLRAATLWALASADRLGADETLHCCERAGIAPSGLRPILTSRQAA